MSHPRMCHHGATRTRGCTHLAVSRFCKLFDLPGLPVSEATAERLGGPGGLMHDFDDLSGDCAIPAGYIFFAQFIDHDITLDGTSELRGEPLDPDGIAALPNVRSVSLDLDCVYGFGPEASPHLYDAERPGRLAVGPDGHDLARAPGGGALIGDPRNDENLFVSQLQLLFHRFHNRLYDERVVPNGGAHDARFELAQRETRFHYQWLVLFDLLKRLCDREVFAFAAAKLVAGDAAFPFFHRPDPCKGLCMPVEFSVAAFRVGHTLVRSTYAVNRDHLDLELFDPAFGLRGFDRIPAELAVDWRYLLPVARCVEPRRCKAVDPLLADELQDLPVVDSRNPVNRALAFRNVLRGNALSLPSGQAVAAALAGVYPAIDPGFAPDIGVPGLEGLEKDTPLFYYILRESERRAGGQRLGPVGSAILMEVFGAMLRFCETSFIHAPKWSPDPCVAGLADGVVLDRDALATDDTFPFELADVVRFVERG